MCYYFCFSSFRSTVICHHYHHWKIAQEISRISCRISCTEKEGKRNRESLGAHGTPLCPLKCLRCLFLLLLLFPIIYLTVLLFERERAKRTKTTTTTSNLPLPIYFCCRFPSSFFLFLKWILPVSPSAARFRCRKILPLPLSLSHLVVNLSISISAAVTKRSRKRERKEVREDECS